MPRVYAIASHIVSALGTGIPAHWHAVQTRSIGIRQYEDASYSNNPFMAARLSPAQWQVIQAQTNTSVPLSPFEQMAVFSARQALGDLDEPLNINDTALILSTTKGNIELLGRVPDEQLLLYHSAKQIAMCLGIRSKPFVISQACVSGVVALQYGMHLLRAGRYKHAIVIGCDRFSRFVLNGFQSFQAISNQPCRPFDAARKGISLGEAVSTIILSADKTDNATGELISGATSNDANHISGPSRTGAELAMAIKRTLEVAHISPAEVGLISAHGTATSFNDEMEAKAFDLAGVLHSPLHSFKGYVGHTLGAAGVLESAMALESLRHQTLISSAGFEHIGVPKAVNVTTEMKPAKIEYALKTASGFGGSNAAIIWKKV